MKRTRMEKLKMSQRNREKTSIESKKYEESMS